MKYNILILSVYLLVCSCKTTYQEVEIITIDTNYSISIRKLSNNNIISYIRFPKKIKLRNKSLDEASFKRIVYNYNSVPKNKGLGLILYEENNNKLERTSNNFKKTVPEKGSLDFIYYTRHFVDSSKTTQEQFKPYVKKMLLENKDTLHIGTVTAFKKKHKELFEKLTKNDSISIRFLDNGSSRNRITVPVKW